MAGMGRSYKSDGAGWSYVTKNRVDSKMELEYRICLNFIVAAANVGCYINYACSNKFTIAIKCVSIRSSAE
jgi:hypothetical protein